MIPNEEEKKSLRRYYFRIGLIMLLLTLVFNIGAVLITKICAGLMTGVWDNASIAEGKSMIKNDPYMRCLYSYGFPIAAEIAAISLGIILTGFSPKKKMNLKKVTSSNMLRFTAITFAIITVAALINQILLAIILILAGKGDSLAQSLTEASVTPSASNPLWLNILVYLYICIIGPILEELMFRGVLLDGLTKYGNAFGIAATALLFGLMHQNYLQCIPAIGIGIAFAYMDVKCGSIVPSIIVHILNNSMSAFLMAMLDKFDLKSLMDISNIAAVKKLLTDSIPLMIILMINVLFRLICIIASIVIAAKYFSNRNRLIENNDYCRNRTWTYFLTSAPWVISMGYMLYKTVTSLPI